jgi:hypothetical protein
MAKHMAPTVAAAVAHTAGAGACHTPQGHAAMACKTVTKACKDTAAKSQAQGNNAPNMHKGVTHKVTQGMASALANKPTADTC